MAHRADTRQDAAMDSKPAQEDDGSPEFRPVFLLPIPFFTWQVFDKGGPLVGVGAVALFVVIGCLVGVPRQLAATVVGWRRDGRDQGR